MDKIKDLPTIPTHAVAYHNTEDGLIHLKNEDGSDIVSNVSIVDGIAVVKDLWLSLTETEAELLTLMVIDIKELWDRADPGKMTKKDHNQIGVHYQSIIDKMSPLIQK